MWIVFGEHVLKVIPAFPFWRRRLVAWARNKRIFRYDRGGAGEIWNVTRAVWEDFARDAHNDFRAMMPGQDFFAFVDRSLASDARAKALSVEAHEQQPDIRVPVNIAKCPVHVVAVILGILERVGSGDFDKTGIAGAHRTIDVVPIARRDEKELRLFDELSVLFPEFEMEPMLLQPVGDTAPIEAVLQLTHAIVVEGGAIDGIGHWDLKAELWHHSHYNRLSS